jgi:hypothetical protein
VAREVARVRALHAQHAHHLMETQPLCHHLMPTHTHNALSGEMDEGPYQRHQRSEASINVARMNERGTSINHSPHDCNESPHDSIMGGCHTMTKYAWYAEEDCSDGSSSACSSASWSAETGRGGDGGARVLLHVAVGSTLQLPAPTPPVHLGGARHVECGSERLAADGQSLGGAGDEGSFPVHHVAFLSEAGNPPEQREAGAEQGAAQERAHGGEARAAQEAHAAAHQEAARGPAEAAADDRQPTHTPPRKPCTASPNGTGVMLAREEQGYHHHDRARRAMVCATPSNASTCSIDETPCVCMLLSRRHSPL